LVELGIPQTLGRKEARQSGRQTGRAEKRRKKIKTIKKAG